MGAAGAQVGRESPRTSSNRGVTDSPGTTRAGTTGHLLTSPPTSFIAEERPSWKGKGSWLRGRAGGHGRAGQEAGQVPLSTPPSMCHIPQAQQVGLEATSGTLQEAGAMGYAWEAHRAPPGRQRGPGGRGGSAGRRPDQLAGWLASAVTATDGETGTERAPPGAAAGWGWAQATSLTLRPPFFLEHLGNPS